MWLDIELDVKQSFFAVQAAQALGDAAQAARDRAVAHRDMAAAAIKNGVRPPVDLAREEAELQRFEVELDNARSSLVLAQSELAAAVGSDRAGIDVTPEPEEVVASQWPALPDEIVEREPELMAVRARIKAQQARSDALGAERLPALWLSGAFSARQGGATPSAGPADRYNGFLPSLANWDVGLVLSWSVFDQVATARVNAARADECVLAAHLTVATQVQKARLRQAFNEVELARRTIPALERALETARENHRQAEARFRAGLGTTVDLGDAEQLLTAAEDGIVVGRLRWAQAKAVYDRLLAVRALP